MSRVLVLGAVALVLFGAPTPRRAVAQAAPAETLGRVQQAMVKVYGAGGLQGIEAYQTGFIASDAGQVVTADSMVLEQGEATVVLASGDRYSARVVGSDPLLRIAVLEFDPAGEPLTTIDLATAREATPGEPLLVFANMFNIAAGNEPVSVMRTRLASTPARQVAFGLAAPRGADRVLLVDSVTSNPGAAGGLLTDFRGRPVGMVGHEVRGRVTGGWLNYATPASQVAASALRIVQGEQMRADAPVAADVDPLPRWGFALVENVAPRTPPYVELVRANTPAAAAGLRSDDLVVMVENLITATVSESRRVLALRDTGAELRITVERDGRLLEMVLTAIGSGAQTKEGL